MAQNRRKLILTLAGFVVVAGAMSAAGTGLSFAAGNPPATNAACSVPSRYPTIQAAVNTPSCSTIKVAPGTYAGNITIGRSLTLSGAKAGQDARIRRAGGDSTIAGGLQPAVIVTADNVKIDGFTLNGPQDPDSAALVMQTHNTGETIQNNVFNNPGRAASITTSKTIFRNNVVKNTATAHDGFQANSGAVNGLTISGNTFSGATPSIYNADVTVINGTTGVVVENNKSTGDGTLAALFFTTGARVTGNTVAGAATSSAVYIGGATHDTTVSGNTINGAASAVKVIAASGGKNAGVSITRNTLRNNGFGVNVIAASTTDAVLVNRNTITGNSTYGVFTDPAAGATTNATCNWWGAVTGPNVGGPGRGDKVSSTVTYKPWLVLPNLTVLCR
jgi:hypothetical protein